SLCNYRARTKNKYGTTYEYDGLRLRFFDETVEVLDRARDIIARTFAEHASVQQGGRGSNGKTITYTGRRVTGFFAALFEVGPKAFLLRMREFVWEGGREIVLAFLAGLLDSDGHASEGRAHYTSATGDFIRDVGTLACLYGLGGGLVVDNGVYTTE